MDRLASWIESDRLTIRQWTEDDAEQLSLAIVASLDHLRPWMAWIAKEPCTVEDRRGLIRRWRSEWEQGGDCVVGAFRDDAVVGSAGLHRRVGPQALEIGYWIHADHIRRGYATEVAAALTSAAFELPDIERVEIHHDKANIASGGVPRRLGFSLVEETPDSVTAPSEIGIECRWVVTRSEWARADESVRE